VVPLLRAVQEVKVTMGEAHPQPPGVAAMVIITLITEPEAVEVLALLELLQQGTQEALEVVEHPLL
jgi:hypothetical protein